MMAALWLFKALRGLINGLPWRVIGVLALAATLVISGHQYGAHQVQRRWDAANLLAALTSAKTEVRQTQATTTVVTQYVDRIKVVRQKAAVIQQETPFYVPSSTCPLPGGLRVLHDAAAAGEVPDPTRVADAPGVPAQTLASTVVGNYSTCLETAEQLTALQQWIHAQAAISDGPGLQASAPQPWRNPPRE